LSAKALILALALFLPLVSGCALPMTAERLEKRAGETLKNLDSYYAELTAVIYSLETEQTYKIREWFQSPDLWRVEVESATGKQVFICDGQHIYIYEPGIGDYYRFSPGQAPLLVPPFLLSDYLRQFLAAPQRSFSG